MTAPKVPAHTYRDQYRLGRCQYCDRRRTSPPTKNCK